jgi:hypothetical protein
MRNFIIIIGVSNKLNPRKVSIIIEVMKVLLLLADNPRTMTVAPGIHHIFADHEVI